ncbi:DNA cytosine methyltransferase [Pedobacter sp. KR3-3]|uniref:Cytosine-specific methyltransferase n=1 Tax=Pedobacter albus TaxID=3113905 RepID=A0ABU7ICZ5_9SPHI|nr:DNA cytosine methyltransferase [Pedobacter sp. KR3-3]MEE1947256.1 DNA cytosine methyltransferase [Pedobacter sp. KR3-3]
MGRKVQALRHGSLFSGIGGFDLAAEWMKWRNVFHCEIDPFCRRILQYYFSKAHSYENIKEADFSPYRGKIDVLTGGFPCQPYSLAGKRLGKEDERHLWPWMLNAIRQIRPGWIVGENVYGIISWNNGLVFEEVQADLEAEGYFVQPYVLPAAGVGAPHRRDRVWFVAHANGQRGHKGEGTETDDRKRTDQEPIPQRGQLRDQYPPAGRTGLSADTAGFGCDGGFGDRQGGHVPDHLDGHAPEAQPQRKIGKRRTGKAGTAEQWGWDGTSDYWADWPTQSPVCTGNDGLSSGLDGITFSKWRKESIKAGGNAIVPQVAYRIFQTIQAIHDRH